MPVIGARKVIAFCAIAAGTLGLIAWRWAPWILGKKISAGAIHFSSEIGPAGQFTINPDELQGSFKISTSFSKTAIPSDGTGGGCLVADLNAFHIPRIPADPDWKCSRNSDCQELPSGWAGYCDANGERTCWVRPGPRDDEHLCNKSPLVAWREGIYPSNEKPFNFSAPYSRSPQLDGSVGLRSFSATYPGPVRWRVVACLNGIHPETGKTKYANAKGEDTRGCAEIDSEYRMEVFGPITTVPPDTSVPALQKVSPPDLPDLGPHPK
jgi:hypothetical protein